MEAIHSKGVRRKMKDGIGFMLFILGIAGIDGWMFNGTSIVIPLVMISVSAFIFRREIKKCILRLKSLD